MKENSLVSIVVRTKDRPELLQKALESISRQTYRPLQVVLVNDGGCDLEIKYLQDILDDIALNYIRLEKNMGRAHAANTGIKNAHGAYIAFLDDDDEYYPEHIDDLVSFLSNQTYYEVVYSDTETVVRHPSTEEIKPARYREKVFSKDFSYNDLLVGNYIPFNSILFSKNVLLSEEIDESMDLYEDWDLLIRISLKHPFYHLKKVTAIYNQWSKDLQINQADPDYMISMHKKVIEKHRDKITPEVILNLKHDKERFETAFNNLLDKYNLLEEKDLDRFKWKESSYVKQIEDTLRERNSRIIQLENTVQVMKETQGWKVLEKFRLFRERTFPQGTIRRRFYELLLKSGRVIHEEGFKSFFIKARRSLKFSKQPGILKADATFYLREEFRRRPVTAILPIYNGHDYLLQCIDSVLRYTDLNFHSLVLIDDKSTDNRNRNYLKKIDTSGKNIKIIYNNKNIGFVKTVNKGMRLAKEDVILLNSDTIVTKAWVEKLQRAAYSGPKIATATPFSNNAIHCSIPDFLKDNTIPEGYSIDSFSKFIEDTSLRYYPEIPTAVGFCVYIKRVLLEQIGYFNELNFDKGYGEECEFCARAHRAGFIHVLDDSTYIYHKGSVSFSPENRLEIVDKHLAIIDKMYPEFLRGVNKYYSENPLRLIHNYIRFRMNLS
jgi:GT2 family glycosyltransferase